MNEALRILIVDDHEDIREPLAAFLARYGLSVSTEADGGALRERLRREQFDLILLDVMLPGEDGLSLCRHVHEHHGIPVILLTAMSDPADRIAGLELGADDYVVKPFDPRELIARIRSIFRRARMAPRALSRPLGGSQCYRFADWQLDLSKRELRHAQGRVVELSAMEFRLLKTLLEHANTVLSRERLLNLMNKADAPVFDRSIDSQVSRLRKKLEDDARHPRLLRTAWGDGYLLSADVHLLAT
ncbi:MAG: DNA-binding response regulator [Candidatus Dactylopiibacterium carminicum]|uniref:DNA-binding response regulator n=1 Tax=Candidatus Dactylopiibacterium carminicum TaxID=857335 RepID=A0A272EV40_9RHOO|nr:response regulator [Candidatus Dactylopiibacterium carminicum]KAF7599853.1 DNA-binding response regulator [Candidatus Dactylopiibacterium carminicum]PAS93964.1 MAG: DNA-binding response regulator [Candidatus Dactylopiibacterium carminicum]PAS97279.1 MAG: DNA-binding response regulator [Candidatus Dactylopiibacterium carminicum]PAS99853.1 MAG: DNA-binding response regulator [Candidatus Dactylopiibacterium carminicum]